MPDCTFVKEELDLFGWYLYIVLGIPVAIEDDNCVCCSEIDTHLVDRFVHVRKGGIRTNKVILLRQLEYTGGTRNDLNLVHKSGL